MHKHIPYLFFGLIFIWGLTVNCYGQATSQNELSEYQALESGFCASDVTEGQLRDFEQRAKQKLQDFADYVEVCSNPDYDKDLRKHASTLLLELFPFDDENVRISLNTQKTQLPEAFVTGLLNNKGASLSLSIDSVDVTEGLKELVPGGYGAGGLFQGLLSVQFSEKKNNKTLNRKVVIQLSKAEKHFGKERKYVWEVYLGRME